jgi:hypothetical protein
MTILAARQLNTQRDLVAQANLFTYSQEDLGSMVLKIFPSIQSGLKSFINFFDVSGSKAGQSLTGSQQTFLRDIAGKNYGDIYTIGIPVPAGLSVPYLDYISVLEEAADFACTDVPMMMNEYTTYLAGLISTQHAMLESHNLNVQYVKKERDREELTEQMAACLNGGTSATRPMKAVVKRNKDWEHVIARAEAVSMRLNKIDRNELNKKIKEATELLDLLGKRVMSGELSEVSPEVVMHLSDGAFQLGKNLEFFAVVYYRACVLSETIVADINYLGECFNNRD